MRRRAGVVAATLVLVACGTDDEPSGALAEHAAPLVGAHEALDAHAERVEADPDGAVEAWPGVAERVDAAVAELPDPDGLDLEPRERSSLVGYSRGLEVATGAWADVHEALAASDTAAAERAADGARERMRHLDRLRNQLEP